ncbi:glycerol-3-phosphate acyltransferase 2, mitochondrial [Electrophorus electricus]|uniref:glycerol-3-phosphate acyltransferase 2, mitochondrial n=1 Tax=Electrophorus electricus TaxID=8005 RepID=UPI0015CFD6B4|nr:glycerol-3-phosphate acyltransferase 2, mitochondrial [Electrophorus electricus]
MSGDASREPLSQRAPAPKHPALSLGVKIRKKLKVVTPFLGKFRPLVGQCCHQCTPESLSRKLLHNAPSLGFRNLLCVNETHTRYRGWLVRRVCCVLFVWGRKVQPSRAGDRPLRVCSRDRVRQVLMPTLCPGERGVEVAEAIGATSEILDLTETSLSPTLLRLVSWLLLKVFSVMFYSLQVNLNQMSGLHRAKQLKCPLVYVYIRQSLLDQALIILTLFCHNLAVPYSVYPATVRSRCMRAVLRRLGIIFLPSHVGTEQEAEADATFTTPMTSLVGELLLAGESLSFGICSESRHGGQWLARVRQAVIDGLVPDVSLVPVGISYDCPPCETTQGQAGVLSVLCSLLSFLSGDHRGGVRIHFAQAFSLKEMCESGKCRVDRGRPLQELLLPAVLLNRVDSIFGQRKVSWLLPPDWMPDLPQAEKEMTTALTLHLIHSVTNSMAVMSTSIVSCLLLHKHPGGVRLSVLCRDVCWLVEEVLFRNSDVGFGGSLVGVVYHALFLMQPCLLLAAAPPKGDPVIAMRPEPNSLLKLSQQCELLRHIFIREAVGACAVTAMLSEVAGCGGSSEMEFDVALGQEELTEKSLQLIHLLPVGYIPPCQTTHSFALDVVDSMVRCGILIMEEVPRTTPVCDFWKRQGVLSWTVTDDPNQSSDSECEEQDTRSYKLSQPSQCPELLFFLCSLLSVQLRALCWTIQSLHLLPTPLTESACVIQLHAHLRSRSQLDKVHHESSSIKLVRLAVRILIDLGVLMEDRQKDAVYLDISPLFLQAENKRKILQFVSQFLYG